MNEMLHAPLIVTLDLDPDSFAFFDEQRRAFFPPDRNWLSAHLTLFHHLPGQEEDKMVLQIAGLAIRHNPIPLRVTGLRFLGRGVAYEIDAPALSRVREEIVSTWWDRLTAQDRQPFNPHVTVQNKVDPGAARALHSELARDFVPFNATGTGLRLWRYIGPAWDPVAQFPFGQTPGTG